jgi:hypothetical protein
MEDWGLPGHGEKKPECGIIKTFGCINVLGHGDHKFEHGDLQGTAYVKVVKWSCGRPQCSEDYEKWASRAGHRIAHRIEEY